MRIIFFILTIFSTVSSANVAPADLVIYNAKLFIQDKISTEYDAVSIKAGKISAIFDSSHSPVSPASKQIDAQGRLLIPGIIDAHHHSITATGVGFHIPLGTMDPSKLQLAEALKEAAVSNPPGTWIFATVGEQIADDESIDAAFLDSIAPQHKVWISAYYGHGDILNSPAMEALNIRELPEQDWGGHYQRNANGQLTGRIFEYAQWIPRAELFNKQDDEAVIAMLQQQAQQAASFGITGWHDMPMLNFSRYISLLQKADLPIRVTAIPMPFISVAKNESLPKPQKLNEKVWVQGEKWILDGTPIERGAALSAGYADRPGWSGRLNFSEQKVKAILTQAMSKQSQLLLHAAGDKTLDQILTLMESITGNWEHLRVRIEHGDGFNPELINRAKKLGVIVVQNPSHMMNPAISATRYSADYPVMYLKTLIESGLPVALGSDGPMNPYLNIMFARVHAMRPQESIDVATALQLYTRGSAYAGKADKLRGEIRVGLDADLALLSQNILEIPAEALPGTRSVLTLVGGNVVHNEL
ncbi:amidohydrolase [Aliiglaciecola litoralis]|uniref:Amidohydrolase n=1 Tax=Aliiglaciecola litoralis TaxID=582857 RepID=A0ABP3WZL1_9ALTE